ncbi:dipeptidase, putative [Ligilactobacillus sp. WC1T17]|uniref:Dipeptidase, putative n=1 Tax=Ligilactobacillus ruminis TaxID=1623 RepID=A0ABY1ADA0_9LACO|nr:dipeptidase, putative [Ligilactobacillus ruminis]
MSELVQAADREAALKALKKMIAVPSYNEPAEPGAPFGPKIKLALAEILKICAELGYQTYQDPNGYYGYAETGSGKETFGIIGHVDTVPAGDLSTWIHDPFSGEIIDNAVYGRGAQDDKGPVVAALFAVKALENRGFKFKQKIRFIFGTDEEILWRGIAQYNKKEESITQGFSPDASFPVTYAEKGLQQAYLVGPGSDEITVDTGSAFNAVPDRAEYFGSKQAEVKAALAKRGFAYHEEDSKIVVEGKAIHAMLAPKGVNAVLRLACALDDVFEGFLPLDFIGKCFKEDATGKNLLGDVQDESGHLTFNISSLKITPKETRMQIDLRVPVTINHEALLDRLRQKVKDYDLIYEPFDYLAPLYVPKDTALVQTLMQVYQKNTGDMTAQPQVSGGATFARTMPNCVAFGGMLPKTPDYMHQANEQWPVDDMFKAMDIFAEAVKKLCVD